VVACTDHFRADVRGIGRVPPSRAAGNGCTDRSVALTTFLINSRYLFYGLSFPLHRVTGWHGKAYSVFALCDEAYALTTSKDPETLTSGRILWTQCGLHASWASGTLVGGLAGESFLAEIKGLGFGLTALFVVLALDAYQNRPDVITLTLAAAAAVVARVALPGSMILIGHEPLRGRPHRPRSRRFSSR
jgi:4-azaleucine resistance transporter AzlC